MPPHEYRTTALPIQPMHTEDRYRVIQRLLVVEVFFKDDLVVLPNHNYTFN
jgi:hypothetical protein